VELRLHPPIRLYGVVWCSVKAQGQLHLYLKKIGYTCQQTGHQDTLTDDTNNSRTSTRASNYKSRGRRDVDRPKNPDKSEERRNL
jgi:hypothetical protein